MLIFKVVAFVLVALFIFLVFKDRRPDMAVLIIMAAGAMVFIFCLSELGQILSFLKNMSEKAGIDMIYLGIILKILAISYLATFTSEICKDAGAGSLASKVEFAGKIFILVLAIPILMAVLDSILLIL
ncbi:stage III sporulation protein AD [Clostridium vincentii]|uniref:Stage III sporulation protein AC/AD protein family protein n=1 Tax=Clostridium vincentii TaxID=52704 RepID=A0A2T0BGK0_9CLOT|nr:stage III sporulation protein AD [Clostridium vincentii]PRR82957.1 Stage III sporulation protein AC/AD protein family protein [Clostridium vincentii]